MPTDGTAYLQELVQRYPSFSHCICDGDDYHALLSGELSPELQAKIHGLLERTAQLYEEWHQLGKAINGNTLTVN